MKDYHSEHMVEFNANEEFNGFGWTSIPVLDFLKGKKWDEVALAFVASLKPTSIRVTRKLVTTDSRMGRMTVYVDENENIKDIEFEVEVGLPDKVVHATALKEALKYGINSPQCQFYNDDDVNMFWYGLEGVLYKLYKDDRPAVMFPYPKGHEFCQDFKNEN